MKTNKILIITTLGGRGHLEAAKAKKQQLLKQNPDNEIIEINVLRDWGWKFITKRLKKWNIAQMLGKVETLTRFVGMQVYADWLLAPRIFIGFMRLLFKENVDRIIDTQNLGLSTSLKVLRFYNWMKGKNVLLEKVIVDLPTKDDTLFFPFIRKLSKKDRKILRLISIKPLLEENQTEEEFWETYCKMPSHQIFYEDNCIRQSFKQIQKVPLNQTFDMTFELGEEMKTLVEPILDKKNFKQNQYNCKIEENDLLLTILLGAEPVINGTLAYLEEILRQCAHLHQSIYVIVFVSNHHSKYKSLCEQVLEKIKQKKTESNVHINPVGFQNEKVIATLLHRSDLIISRSGGQTAMELLALRKNRETWIHSETKSMSNEQDQLLEGMPKWEAGNARYLQKHIGIKIINPQIFQEAFKHFLEKSILSIR